MGFCPWISCLWPGLPRLWWRGEWRGFFTAVVFALGFNAGLISTFIAPQWVAPIWRIVLWLGVALFWCVSFRSAAGRLSQIYGGDGRYNDDQFRRAQEEYLKGQWFEAESLLLRLVRDEPADVEGRLLLATLYRHTRRPDLAETQLDQMERYPHAARWAWEIRQERQRLKQAPTEASAEATATPHADRPVVPEDAYEAMGIAPVAPAAGEKANEEPNQLGRLPKAA